MNKVNFALVIHFHQPVGNFEHVFARAYERCYFPFLEAVESYPELCVTLHYSGCLLEWLEKKYPAFLDKIALLISRGQVELMSGGFYEPILTAIPKRDALGQINMLTKYIISRFSFNPEGIWLAERVWEPHLPEIIKDAGMNYMVIDDNHLLYSGIRPWEMYGYYLTEEGGKTVAVFPSSKRLRYSIPFKEVSYTLDYLKEIASPEGNKILVYGDDGEKFGEWPGTYEWVYEKRWLDHFFQALRENKDWINLITLSNYLKNHSPLGRIYLPTASYIEMMEWALPSESAIQFEEVLEDIKRSNKEEFYLPFVRGGFWRNFLAKYPEANHMHKRMLMVSEKVHQLANQKNGANPSEIEEARKELYKGQCNCSYWHGIFGGIYLPHMRSAIYQHLIRAETIAESLLQGKMDWVEARVFDFDCDGKEEVIMSNPYLSLVFDPDEGGMMTELDFRPLCLNLINPLARKKEAYHLKLESFSGTSEGVRSIHEGIFMKEEGLERKLFYDWYKRGSLIDHFLNPGTTLEEFMNCQYEELGDFVNQPYSYEIRALNGDKKVHLRRKGQVSKEEIVISKEVKIEKKDSPLEIRYQIDNLAEVSRELWFGVEFNLFLLLNAEGTISYPSVDRLSFKDGLLEVELEFSQAASLWKFPLETVSLSEAGLERNYQSIVLLPRWKIPLLPGGSWCLDITIKLVVSSQ